MPQVNAVRLTVDRAVCAGHGLCYGHDSELVGYDEQGDPVPRLAQLPPDLLRRAEELIDRCPERALSLEQIQVSRRPREATLTNDTSMRTGALPT